MEKMLKSCPGSGEGNIEPRHPMGEKLAKNSCKGTRWVFTINNYTQKDLDEIWEAQEFKYLKFSFEEAPTTHTPHIQGYCEIEDSQRLSYMKKINGRANWFKAKGTKEENDLYLAGNKVVDGKKIFIAPIGGPYEKGQHKKQGERNDLNGACEELKEGKTPDEIMEATPSHLKHEKYLHRYQAILMKKRMKDWHPVEVIAYIGETGKGKTRAARECPDEYYLKDNTKWWDMYNYEKTVVWNEFKWYKIDIEDFLDLLDGRVVRREIKGGYVMVDVHKLIITANTEIDTWWPGADEKTKEAIKRRITKTIRL